MKVRNRLALTTVPIAIVFVFVSGAMAATAIREGKGAGKARLGQIDSTAAARLGVHSQTLRDPNYGSRIVYMINVGRKMKNRRYPCELLSNASHRVFQFTFNSASYVTRKGIRVGSARSRLVARYPGMKRIHTTKFDHYVLGRRPYTDFWVLNKTQRVYQIIVRSK